MNAIYRDDRLDQKVAVITGGGGRGIGAGIAKHLASLGGRILILEHPDFDESMSMFDVLKVDLASAKEIANVIPQIVQDYGHCDFLINNARAGERLAPLTETPENLQFTFDVGMTAPAMLSQQFVDYASQTPDCSRAIVNISSVLAQYVGGESTGYDMTKAGLESLTRYLAVHGGAHKVRVNAIAPGLIIKDEHLARFNQDDNKTYRGDALTVHPLEDVGTEEDVANLVVYLISDASKFITGQTFALDGGMMLRDGFTNAVLMREKFNAGE